MGSERRRRWRGQSVCQIGSGRLNQRHALARLWARLTIFITTTTSSSEARRDEQAADDVGIGRLEDLRLRGTYMESVGDTIPGGLVSRMKSNAQMHHGARHGGHLCKDFAEHGTWTSHPKDGYRGPCCFQRHGENMHERLYMTEHGGFESGSSSSSSIISFLCQTCLLRA